MNNKNLYSSREEEKYNNDENSVFDIKNIKIFDMKELKDKKLKIKSFSEENYSIVVGFDEESKEIFLLNEQKKYVENKKRSNE